MATRECLFQTGSVGNGEQHPVSTLVYRVMRNSSCFLALMAHTFNSVVAHYGEVELQDVDAIFKTDVTFWKKSLTHWRGSRPA